MPFEELDVSLFDTFDRRPGNIAAYSGTKDSQCSKNGVIVYTLYTLQLITSKAKLDISSSLRTYLGTFGDALQEIISKNVDFSLFGNRCNFLEFRAHYVRLMNF